MHEAEQKWPLCLEKVCLLFVMHEFPSQCCMCFLTWLLRKRSNVFVGGVVDFEGSQSRTTRGRAQTVRWSCRSWTSCQFILVTCNLGVKNRSEHTRNVVCMTCLNSFISQNNCVCTITAGTVKEKVVLLNQIMEVQSWQIGKLCSQPDHLLVFLLMCLCVADWCCCCACHSELVPLSFVKDLYVAVVWNDSNSCCWATVACDWQHKLDLMKSSNGRLMLQVF